MLFPVFFVAFVLNAACGVRYLSFVRVPGPSQVVCARRSVRSGLRFGSGGLVVRVDI